MDKRAELTQLLHEAHGGSEEAVERVWTEVYRELQRIARAQLRRQPSDTLSATAVVHEAYLKLFGVDPVGVRDRNHFYSLSARAMRQVLVDHYRRKASAKRGGAAVLETLQGDELMLDERGDVVLALDEALSRLHEASPRQARVVELRFFGGMTEKEIGELLEVSDRTVRTDWRMARAWLYRSLRTS